MCVAACQALDNSTQSGSGPLSVGNHPNNGGVVAVFLRRGTDNSFIPYVRLHGISLIAMLRMKLVAQQRAHAYHQFVALPLYQDMAPWNIVFVGVRVWCLASTRRRCSC